MVMVAILGYDIGKIATAIQLIEQEMSLPGFQKEFVMASLNEIG